MSDYILWMRYNRETKSTQFDCPTLTASFNAFLFTRKIWLDHSNVSKLFSTTEKKKLTLQYFSVTLGICTANSNIQESSSFSPIFGDSSAIWHKHWKTQKNFLQAVISNLFGFLIQQLAATLELTGGRALQGFSLLDTQKCTRHKQLPGNAPRVQPFCYTTLQQASPFNKYTIHKINFNLALLVFCWLHLLPQGVGKAGTFLHQAQFI